MIIKPRKKKKRGPRHISKSVEVAKAILLLVVISAVLRAFVFHPFRVPDQGMQSGLYPGDFLLTSKLTYKMDKPAIGDLVLIKNPIKIGEKLVSRIVAIEGQTVEISGKTVYVDGQPFKEFDSAQHSDYRILPADFSNRDYMSPQQVPPGHIFVLGDNRDNSEDSRNFGPVPNDGILGKGLFVYFSWTPDPNAPKLESPYIVPAIHLFFYNVANFTSRVRWDRLFT
jgi:signal peptidase I